MNDHVDDSAARGIVPSPANGSHHVSWSWTRNIPASPFFLLVFFFIKLTGANLREVMFAAGPYEFSGVDFIYITVFLMVIMELLKVAHPGEDNAEEVLWILAAWLLAFVLFVLGAAGVRLWIFTFASFNNTEFLLVLIVLGLEVVAGFLLNARTTGRSVEYSRDH